MAFTKVESKNKRKARAAYKIRKSNKSNKSILGVSRSNKNIYAQIVDLEGKVVVSFSTKNKEISGSLEGKTGVEKAVLVGQKIAEKALAAGVKEVVFNKGPYRYSGRVKALAEAAREKGLVL